MTRAWIANSFCQQLLRYYWNALTDEKKWEAPKGFAPPPAKRQARAKGARAKGEDDSSALSALGGYASSDSD